MSTSRESKYRYDLGHTQKELDQLRTEYDPNHTAIHLFYVLRYQVIADLITHFEESERNKPITKSDIALIQYNVNKLKKAIEFMNELYKSGPGENFDSSVYSSVFSRFPDRTYAEVMEYVRTYVPESHAKEGVVRYFPINLHGPDTKIGNIWELYLIVTALLKSGYYPDTNKPFYSLFNFSEEMVKVMRELLSREMFDFANFILVISITNYHYVLNRMSDKNFQMPEFKELVDKANLLDRIQRAYGEIVTSDSETSVKPLVSVTPSQSQELNDDINSMVLLPKLPSAALQRVLMVSRRHSSLFMQTNAWRQRIIKIGIDEKIIRELEEIAGLFEQKTALDYKTIALHLARLDFYLPSAQRYLLIEKLYQLCILISCTNDAAFLQFVPKQMNLYVAILAGYSRSNNIITAYKQSNPDLVDRANAYILHDDCKLQPLTPAENNKQPTKVSRLVKFAEDRKDVAFDSKKYVNPYDHIHRRLLKAIEDNDIGLLLTLFKEYDVEKLIMKNIKSSKWFKKLLYCAIKYKNIAAMQYLIDISDVLHMQLVVNKRNTLGKTFIFRVRDALFVAASTGDPKVVQALFSAVYVRLRYTNKQIYNMNAFAMIVSGAIESGNKDFLGQIISNRSKLFPNNKDKIQLRTSRLSVKPEVMENLRLAIDSNEIDLIEDIGEYFIRYGDVDLFKSTLAMISVTIKTLLAAVRYSKSEMVDFLLNNNGFNLVMNPEALSELSLLAERSSSSYLAERVIDHFDCQGAILSCAIRYGHLKVVEKMLNSGVRSNVNGVHRDCLIDRTIITKGIPFLNSICSNLENKRLSADYYRTQNEFEEYIRFAAFNESFDIIRRLIEMKNQSGEYYSIPTMRLSSLRDKSGSSEVMLKHQECLSIRDNHGNALFIIEAHDIDHVISTLMLLEESLTQTMMASLFACENALRTVVAKCDSTDIIQLRTLIRKIYQLSPVYLIQSLEQVFADPKRYKVNEQGCANLRYLVTDLLNDANNTKGDILLISKLLPDLRRQLVQTIRSTPSMKH